MRFSISTLLVFSFSLFCRGQGIVQNGGFVVLNNDVHVVLDGGANGNYYDTLGGLIRMEGNPRFSFPGNWYNQSSGVIFLTNDGEVILSGGVQELYGNNKTSFPSLDLLGAGDKHLRSPVLVGGANAGNGVLRLRDNSLYLNSNRLEINNDQAAAVTRGTGGVVSGTPPSTGVGTVQWTLRAETGNYVVPFIGPGGEYLPYSASVTNSGVNATDSGFIAVATYSTPTAASPNNRELPTGVTSTDNIYGREWSAAMLDRYWIVESGGYTAQPSLTPSYTYRDAEWDGSGGSTNDIDEDWLRLIRFDAINGNWTDPGIGLLNSTTNRATGLNNSDFVGTWSLSDSIPCPIASFSGIGNCVGIPVQLNDLTTIGEGSLETWDWDFDDGNSSNEQNPEHTYNSAGQQNVELIVVANSGCPDTFRLVINILERAIADFTVSDWPTVDKVTNFTNTSSNSTSYFWDLGDGSQSTDSDPSHTYKGDGEYDVLLIANNSSDCPDTIVQRIEVIKQGAYFFPTAFTPGERDDLNRTFGLSSELPLTDFRMEIFNRWGEKIFETENENERWDGTYQDQPVMAGNYLYTISLRDHTQRAFHFKGVVTVIR